MIYRKSSLEGNCLRLLDVTNTLKPLPLPPLLQYLCLVLKTTSKPTEIQMYS